MRKSKGWEVVDIMDHKAGNKEWISIWASTVDELDYKVYEIWPDVKILQRYDGIDLSEVK